MESIKIIDNFFKNKNPHMRKIFWHKYLLIKTHNRKLADDYLEMSGNKVSDYNFYLKTIKPRLENYIHMKELSDIILSIRRIYG